MSFSKRIIPRSVWLTLSLLFCTSLQAQLPSRSAGAQAVESSGQVPTVRISNQEVQPERSGQVAPRKDVNKEESREDASASSPSRRVNEPRSEFQEFVLASTGKLLPIFGRNLFGEVPSTFAPVDRIPVTAEYVIGPGDEVVLRGWGQIDIDYRATVDRLGAIYVPKVGSINVAGLRYSQLQPYLKTAISRIFQNFDLNVTLGQLRSIQVFVVGHAQRPGSYTVSSLSTLVNALFASGGPSNQGSMRRIQLKRGRDVVTEFDLYDLLINGDKSKDAPLLQGDVIYIPAVTSLVAVTGSVAVPAIYELKDESSFGEVLRMAGGISPTAAADVATVERIRDHAVRSVEEFSFTAQGLASPVRNGDLIVVRPLVGRFENAVTLRGNVASPGRYPWKAGMRISDLIRSKETLVTREYWLGQQQLGSSQQRRAPTEDRPTKTDSGITTEAGQRSAEVQQELRNEIKRTAPDVNWDYAVIQRFDAQRLTSSLIPFNLGKSLDEPNTDYNLVLEPGDVVTVFSQADLKVPETRQNKLVRLEGEFATAGVYEALPGETFKQLVQRVGGLTQEAYLYGLQFTRESVREAQQQRYDEFVENLDREVERTASQKSQNIVSAEEAAGLKEKIESQRVLVDKLRKIKVNGRVLLGVTSHTSWEGLPDFPLEDGDRIYVPFRPATVHVVGAVYSENSFLFEDGRRASFYLAKAGGGTRTADAERAFIVRADGTVANRGLTRSWFGESWSSVRLMPGDTIVVPEKLDRVSFLKGLRDWSQVIGQFGLGIAAVWTLTR